jgi:diguanylate cyclase (GGDEF)-like protein
MHNKLSFNIQHSRLGTNDGANCCNASVRVIDHPSECVEQHGIQPQEGFPEISTATILQLLSEAILICDCDTHRIICCNDLASRLLEFERSERHRFQLGDFIRDVELMQRLQNLSSHDGDPEAICWNGRLVTALGNEARVEGTVRQITADTGQRLISMAVRTVPSVAQHFHATAVLNHDELTGLPTRGALKRHLEALMGRKDNCAGTLALLFVDLDGFKLVNDTYGHHVGDTALSLVAERLLEITRPGDLVARYGGDEFVVVLSNVERNETAKIVERVRNTIEGPLRGPNWTAFISVSVGVACCSGQLESAEQLLQTADHAMYEDKRLRRSRRIDSFSQRTAQT